MYKYFLCTSKYYSNSANELEEHYLDLRYAGTLS